MSETPDPTSSQIMSATLEALAAPGASKMMGGVEDLAKAVLEKMPDSWKLDSAHVMEALWTLLGQGLVYLNVYRVVEHPARWRFELTAAGRAAVIDDQFNPDSPDKFLERLHKRVPSPSDTVLVYTREALSTYMHRNYLASSVMLGVASEAAFLEMAEAFVRWLPPGEAKKLEELLAQPTSNYVGKFKEYRKRLETHKNRLPEELRTNLSLYLDSILDLLRVNRNDAGHPTGKKLSRDDQKLHLEMFALYLGRMYALLAFFDDPANRP